MTASVRVVFISKRNLDIPIHHHLVVTDCVFLFSFGFGCAKRQPGIINAHYPTPATSEHLTKSFPREQLHLNKGDGAAWKTYKIITAGVFRMSYCRKRRRKRAAVTGSALPFGIQKAFHYYHKGSSNSIYHDR